MSSLVDFLDATPGSFCLGAPNWPHTAASLLAAAATLATLAALLIIRRRRPDLTAAPVLPLASAFLLVSAARQLLGALPACAPVVQLHNPLAALAALLGLAAALAFLHTLSTAPTQPSPLALQHANDALAREVATTAETATLLRHSEARLRQIYARTPVPLHATDANGIVLDVSDRWLDLIGYERDDVVGHSIAEFYDPASATQSADHLAALQAGSNLLHCERRILCADGTRRDIELTLETERDAGGRLLRILAAVTDITARKDAEAALASAEERLRQAQKMEAVGQLTGGIAHDFNNLLTTILGSLELLTQRGSLDARAQRLVGNAQEAARRGARLVSQLLSFSRRQMLSPEAVDPADIVDAIRDLLAQTLGRRIQLDTPPNTAPAPWRAMADRNQVEAALLNLIINARDAIPADGRVTIDIGQITLDAATLAAGTYLFEANHPPAPGDYVCLAVTDTGTGMNAATQARAFEPFFTTKPPGSGTGLGLAQLYGFVSQSGGAVRLQSAPGQGTRIEMLLPRAR